VSQGASSTQNAPPKLSLRHLPSNGATETNLADTMSKVVSPLLVGVATAWWTISCLHTHWVAFRRSVLSVRDDGRYMYAADSSSHTYPAGAKRVAHPLVCRSLFCEREQAIKRGHVMSSSPADA
jgi:hypothetical protein